MLHGYYTFVADLQPAKLLDTNPISDIDPLLNRSRSIKSPECNHNFLLMQARVI